MASCKANLDQSGSGNVCQLDAPVDQLIDFSNEKEINVPEALKTLGETDDTFGIFLPQTPELDHVLSGNVCQLDAPVDQLIDFSDEKEINVPEALKTLGETDDTFGIFLPQTSELDHVLSSSSSPSVEDKPQCSRISISSADLFLDAEGPPAAGSFAQEDKYGDDDKIIEAQADAETAPNAIKEEQSVLVDDVEETIGASLVACREDYIDDAELASPNVSVESGILDINNMSTFNLSSCEEISADHLKVTSQKHQESEGVENIICPLEKSPQLALTPKKEETIPPPLQTATAAELCPDVTCDDEKKENPSIRPMPTLESIRRKVEEIFYYVSPVGGLTAAPEYSHLNGIRESPEFNSELENAAFPTEVDFEVSRENMSPVSKLEQSMHGMPHTPIIQRSRTPLRLVYESDTQPTMTVAHEIPNLKEQVLPDTIKIKKHLDPLVSKLGFHRGKAPQAIRPIKATFVPSDVKRAADTDCPIPAKCVKRNPPTTPTKNQKFIPPIASSSPIVTNGSAKTPVRRSVSSSGYGQPAMNTSASASVLNTSRIPPPSPRSSLSLMPRYAPSPARRQSTSSVPSPSLLDKRQSEAVAVLDPPLSKIKKTLSGTGIPRLPTSKSIGKRSHSFTVSK